jgi:hypothetical protein
MSQRRELSTDCEHASPVVRDLFRDRTHPFDTPIATTVNTARPEASARPGIDEAGWLSALVVSAAPAGSSDPEALGRWSHSRADQTEPVRAPFGGAC